MKEKGGEGERGRENERKGARRQETKREGDRAVFPPSLMVSPRLSNDTSRQKKHFSAQPFIMTQARPTKLTRMHVARNARGLRGFAAHVEMPPSTSATYVARAAVPHPLARGGVSWGVAYPALPALLSRPPSLAPALLEVEQCILDRWPSQE